MEKRKPVESRVLSQMREARGWKKNRLARALGLTEPSLYDYESGKLTPSRELLEGAAGKMGYPPSMVDRTFSYLRLADAERDLGAATAGAAHREIRLAAAQTGLEVEEFVVATTLRIETRLGAFIERRLAPWLWERLKPLAPERRRALVRENPDFHSWGLSELLGRLSVDAAAHSADEAVELADLAVLVASLVPGSKTWRWRVQGEAGIALGNAHRVQGQLPKAGETFQEALRLWEDGAPGDPERLLDEARVLDLEASLRRAQRRLPEALDLLDRALAADRTGTRAGRILIIRAKTLEELGRYEEAIETLERALPRVDNEREPRVGLLRFNLLDYLFQVGRHAEAETMIEEVRELTIRLGNELDLVRLTWLGGRIAALRGQAQEAEAAFEQVRQAFLARRIAFDTALITFELAVLHLREGRFAEVQELSSSAPPGLQGPEGLPRGLRHRQAVLRGRGEGDHHRGACAELFGRLAAGRVVSFPLSRRIGRVVGRGGQGGEGL